MVSAFRITKADSHRAEMFCKGMLDAGFNSDRVQYLASGRYSDCFTIRVTGTKEVVAKVSTYREGCLRAVAQWMAHDDYERAKAVIMTDAVSISNRLSIITNLMLHMGTTPHLVWAFGNYDCKGFLQHVSKHKVGLPLRKRLREFAHERGALQRTWNNVSFHERFQMDLTDFLKNHYPSTYCLKCIIFQVIYTVACLQTAMPGFRHNDLSTNNIFVTIHNGLGDHCTQYTVHGQVMYTCIPSILIALADWDFAHCPNAVHVVGGPISLQNERVKSGAYSLKTLPNPTYDVHFFLTTLQQQLQERPRAHGDVLAFLRAVTGKWSDRTDVFLPRLSPAAVIQHAFFSELTNRPDKPVGAKFTTNSLLTPHIIDDIQRN